MAFDRLIVNSIVRVTKDSIKFDQSIDALKVKVLDLGKNFISEAGINKIPNIDKIINLSNIEDVNNLPKPDINNLVSSEVLSQIGEIPNSAEILSKIEKFEFTLNNILNTKNRINNVLYKVQTTLETTRKTADTINKLLSGIEASVTLIKLLPIPTAYPPGIGIPIGIINTFSDILDKLSDYAKKGKGPLSQIPQVLKIINGIIQNIIIKLNSLDRIILLLLQTIVILKTLIKYGPNATESEISEVIEETSSKLDLSSVGNNSSPTLNTLNEDALLKCLQSNSNEPCIYKGFVLQLEYDPNNKFSFPSRRIKGYNEDLNKLVFNNSIYDSDNPEGYSFSSSLETLLEEIKYVIDYYLNNITVGGSVEELENLEIDIPEYPPFGEEGKNGEIRKFMSDYYRYNNNTKQWEFIVVDLSPFNKFGAFDGEVQEIETTEEKIEISEERINDWNIFDGKKKYKISTITYNIVYNSTYVWSSSSYKWIIKDKKEKSIIEKSRKTKIIKR